MKRIEGLSRSEAAQRAGVTPIYIDLLARQGRIRFKQTALGRLFDANSVDAFAADRQRRALRDGRVSRWMREAS